MIDKISSSLLGVLAIGLLAGCYDESTVTRLRQDSFNAGYGQGKEAGFQAGYSQGKTDGFSSGYAQGKTEGYHSGYQVGRTEGKEAGFTEGHGVGHATGYDEGHQIGKSEGTQEGFKKGKLEGWIAGNSAFIANTIVPGAGLTILLIVCAAGAYFLCRALKQPVLCRVNEAVDFIHARSRHAAQMRRLNREFKAHKARLAIESGLAAQEKGAEIRAKLGVHSNELTILDRKFTSRYASEILRAKIRHDRQLFKLLRSLIAKYGPHINPHFLAQIRLTSNQKPQTTLEHHE